jgi:thioredoxin 2
MIRRCPECGRDNRVPARHLADAGRCGACKAGFGPLSEPLDVDEREFDDIVKNSTVPVLVDFWAPWCGPCRMAAPEVKKAAQRLAGKAVVLKVNSDEQPAVSSRFAVRSIPSFAVFNKGQRVSQQAGAMTADRLVALIAIARASAA